MIDNINSRKTALYVRVSTVYQVDKDSLPHQKKELTAYCSHVLHVPDDLIEIYEDAGVSGKNTDRPGFQRMMADIRAGRVENVVVHKIDRISRNLVDFSLMYDEFKKYRVTFISLNEQFDTSTAIGEAILKIILVFAELERKMTSERVTGVMIGRAEAGLWNGARVPYGWRWNEQEKRPEHDEAEAPVVRKIFELYLQTGSTSKVRDYLNGNSIKTKRGGWWTTKTVADILRNPINCGDYRYNYRESSHGALKDPKDVVYIRDAFPPIVPRETLEEAVALLESHKLAVNQPGFVHQKDIFHAFAGHLVCGSCGSHMTVVKKDKTRNSGFRPSTYTCYAKRNKRTCTAPGTSDVTVGPFVFNYISALARAAAMREQIRSADELEKVLLSDETFRDVAGLGSEGLAELYALLTGEHPDGYEYRPDQLTGSAADRMGEAQQLREQIERSTRALERLKKLYLFGDESIPEKEYLETRAELEGERVKAENALRALNVSMATTVPESAFIRSAASFLIAHEIQKGGHIDYPTFAAAVGDKGIRDFVDLTVDKVTVSGKRVDAIRMKNGITHKFIYK